MNDNETISGIEVNFSSGGGAHSASVSSIEGSESPEGGKDLGKISGEAGERPVFSEEKLNELLENFILTEKTVSKDPVKTTISRKYSDKTSLILQANILLVRGINASPDNNLYFDGIVPFWGEVSNAPKGHRFPVLGPIKRGGVVVVGKIYNSSSKDTSLPRGDGEGYEMHQSSLVYNNGIFKAELSQNGDRLNPRQISLPNLTSFSLKFGYSLSDFRGAMNQIGVEITGLPDFSDVLFEYSGTFESVISSIASDIGYYWFVHPKTGVVTMVNSEIAANYEIEDPTEEDSNETVLSCSYTKSSLAPVIVNTYVGSTQKGGDGGGGGASGTRSFATEFNRMYFDASVGDLTYKVCAGFLGLFLSGQFNYPNFKKMAWGLLGAYRGQVHPLFGNAYPYSIDRRVLLLGWGKIKTHKDGTKDNAGGNPNISLTIGDRGGANYMQLKFNKNAVPEPALVKLFEALKLYYENFGGIGITHGFSEYKSDRMSFPNGSGVSILGPFKDSQTIRSIKVLETLNTQLVKLGLGNVTIGDLAKKAKIQRRPSLDRHFISIRNVKEFAQEALEKQLDNGKGDLDYNFLESSMEIIEKGGGGCFYVGGHGNWEGRLKEKLKSSIRLYAAIVDRGGVDNVSYTYSRNVTNKDKATSKDPSDSGGASSSGADKQQQLTNNVDLKNYSLEMNGADGTPLKRATLNASNGSTLDMETLKSINASQEKPEDPLVSSSKTIYGLEIPEFKPTIASLSISVGSDGVTTKVGESSVKIIPIDMEIMKDRHLKTSISKSNTARLLAGQKNFLGL